MGRVTISLGNSAELIIDEPSSASPSDRALVLTHAVARSFSKHPRRQFETIGGSLPLRIGHRLVEVYYQLKVKKALDALTAYSEAIKHIEDNMLGYDDRLARKAIEVLRQCCRAELKS
jgi:hypothetical protein